MAGMDLNFLNNAMATYRAFGNAQKSTQPKQANASSGINKYAASGIEALAGYFLQPKRKFKTTSKASLDAATLPAMRQAANARQAQLNASQGAQGGAGSASAYENVIMRTHNAQQIGQQSALNQVAADNSQNASYANDYQNKTQRLKSALSLGSAGWNVNNNATHYVMINGRRVLVDGQGHEVVK